MATYKLIWKRSAQKELKKIDKKEIPNIIAAAKSLVSDPFPTNSKKLLGTNQTFRLRVKNYRVIYSVFEDKLIIDLIRVGHRKDIYKNL